MLKTIFVYFSKFKQQESKPKIASDVDFSQLLQHFIAVQDRHKEYKRISRNKEISTSDRGFRNET